MKVILFDTETTGFAKANTAPLESQPHIIELGAIFVDTKYKRNYVRAELTQLINPNVPIPARATKVNGITDEMVKDAPTFKDYFPQLKDFFGSGVDLLICHNAPFDVKMLQIELRRLQHDIPGTIIIRPKRTICTVQEYKGLMGKWPKMTELYEHIMGKPLEQSHRALDDCHKLLEILMKDNFFDKVK